MFNGLTWEPADSIPNSAYGVITIRSNHNVFSVSNLSLDQLVIEVDGRLAFGEASLTILDGPGIDFECYGIFPLNTSGLEIAAAADAIFRNGSQLPVSAYSSFSGQGTLTLELGTIFEVDCGTERTTFYNLTINNYTTLTWISGNISLYDAARFNNYGTININSASIMMNEEEGAQSFNNFSSGVILSNIASGEVQILTRFNNKGLLEIQSGQFTVNDSLSENEGRLVVFSGSVFSSTNGYIQRGELVNNGSILNTLIMKGTGGEQILYGSGTLERLLVLDGPKIKLNQEQTITQSLLLLDGKIQTNSGKLILADGAPIYGASSSNYIIGNLQQYFNIGIPGPREFPVGTASGPGFVTLDPSYTGSGFVEVRVNDNDHPNIGTSGIDPNKSVNKYWSIINQGLTFSECDLYFNWLDDAFDAGANSANFIVKQFNNPDWTETTVSNIEPFSIGVQNVTSFGDYQIGEIAGPCTGPQITCATNFSVCQNSAEGACGLVLTPPVVIPAIPTIINIDRSITYSGVSLNGGGNSIVVEPGATVNLAYNLSVAFDYGSGYCPGCVVQTHIGLGGTTQTLQCDDNIGDGYSNAHNLNFVAPTSPGIYYLTEEMSLDFFCQEFRYNNNPARAIGVLVVGPPFPVVVGGCGNVVLSNNAPSCFPVGTTELIWTAKDGENNVATCSQFITVEPGTLYYRDRDQDGYGSTTYSVYGC
ncbi:MAG TPA: hypothetical protein PKY12_09595, partial [Catalimonadaceae bacterium]|nr:hypothetical protein [Catalimonadaceae bacterium]